MAWSLGLALVLVACCVVAVLSQETSATATPSSSILTGTPFAVPVDGAGTVRLEALGITMVVGPELSRQGLVGVLGADRSRRSTSIAFTTRELAKRNRLCDGSRGWIGVMTRYEGPSSGMAEHEHAHGSTKFDYPGFHISYQTVQKSCVASTPGYAADDLTNETVAASQLWEAMGNAEPL